MDAIYPITTEAKLYSDQQLPNLLNPETFVPPMDLRTGNYQTPKNLSQKQALFPGLAMFYDYFKVVRRDRAAVRHQKYSDYLWALSALELTRLFEKYGANFHIDGLENLQGSSSPVVFAVNHMSTLETQTLCGYITPYMPTTYIVKSSLAKGYFAPLICSRPFIALERKNPLHDLERVLQEGSTILEQGRSIIIFPQGTREEGCFTRSRFNSIAVKLAIKARVPVVPVALSTTFWSRPDNKMIQYIPLLRPEKTVYFSFGPQISTEGARRGKKEQTQVLDFISDRMERWNIPIFP